MEAFIYRLLESAVFGNILSIAGILIALVGFFLTIRAARKSRTAAQQAEQAVQRMRDDIRKYDTVAEFSTALSIMEEIKRLHREGAWKVLPDRYSTLRQLLISIRATNPSLSNKQKEIMQNALMHFTGIERQVEKVNATNQIPPSIPRLNSIVSNQIDGLKSILVDIRNTIGEEK